MKKLFVLSLLLSQSVDVSAWGGENRRALASLFSTVKEAVFGEEENIYGISKEELTLIRADACQKAFDAFFEHYCFLRVFSMYDGSKRKAAITRYIIESTRPDVQAIEYQDYFNEIIRSALVVDVNAQSSKSGRVMRYEPSDADIEAGKSDVIAFFRLKAIEKVYSKKWQKRPLFKDMPEFSDATQSSSSSAYPAEMSSFTRGKDVLALYTQFLEKQKRLLGCLDPFGSHIGSHKIKTETVTLNLAFYSQTLGYDFLGGLIQKYLRFIEQYESIFTKKHIELTAKFHHYYGWRDHNDYRQCEGFDEYDNPMGSLDIHKACFFTYVYPNGDFQPITSYFIFCDMLDKMDVVYERANAEQRQKIEEFLDYLQGFFLSLD